MSDALPKHCGGSDQCGADLRALVLDLVVGETEGAHPGDHVGTVPACIARLGRGSAVVAKAVRLHDQAKVGPEEVDLEAVNRSVC
jgi:hypothetical protein